tara:strand:- start:7307 stop:7537 length:231 start_codon:yes stop_codon:yes gene_type:complete
MNMHYYNHTKRRKATPNEIAKKLIIDRIESMCAIHEQQGCEDLTDKQADDVGRHYTRHMLSIVRRLSNGDLISVEY